MRRVTVLDCSSPEILQRPALQPGAPLFGARAPSAPAPLPTLAEGPARAARPPVAPGPGVTCPPARTPPPPTLFPPRCGDAAIAPRPLFRRPWAAAAPASARRRPRPRSIRHSIVTFWLRCCLSVCPFSPSPPRGIALGPGPAAHDPRARACALVPLSSADLAVADSRSSHAATRPLSSDAAGRRSAGRFRQLRSERIRSSVVNGGRRPE